MYLDPIIQRYTSLGLPVTRGCPESVLQLLERRLSVSFPLAYREFLAWAGDYAGALFDGTDYRCDELFHIQSWARELLADDQFALPLPHDAIVVLMHQGYHFTFLRTNEGDDPPIYTYLEHQTEAVFQRHMPFSALIDAWIDGIVR